MKLCLCGAPVAPKPHNAKQCVRCLNDYRFWHVPLAAETIIPCFYCGTRRLTPRIREHRLPKARGGDDGPNLVPACMSCNIKKGRRTVEEVSRGLQWTAVLRRVRWSFRD